ncbi:hypothetical protein FIBSPDRAFT_955430 [Athelia psychrophila]|uniref:LPXTG-domain-containing protein n=1 Tax=Athelia psychrophila TaxID=1759441 RepID=A0A166I8D3_9AGAM|nr:hypothetical protein FIBSPDRAFT_955430 [Fibularhizoctonia sp. CBS 109695]
MHFSLSTAALLLGYVSCALGQATTNATCTQDQSWSYNDLKQSPCQISAFLGAACNHGQWNIQPLPSGFTYSGPEGSTVNPCQCSTVTYAMTSACAACQNGTWLSWSAWSSSCTTVYPSIYTEAINLTTSIPGWAYGDFISPGTFEVAQASANITASPSTGTAPMTATNTNTISSSATSSSSVVLLGLIACGIAFLLYRRRMRTAPSAQFSNYAASSQAPIHSPVMMSEPYSPQPFNPTQAKFYNPDDPTTYPGTPPPGTIHTTDTSSLASPSRAGAPGQYSFAPEV